MGMFEGQAVPTRLSGCVSSTRNHQQLRIRCTKHRVKMFHWAGLRQKQRKVFSPRSSNKVEPTTARSLHKHRLKIIV